MKLEREKKKVIFKQLPTTRGITCGLENPASLECQFYELEGGELATVFTPQDIHEGHVGVMHGGLSAAVLDETMGRATMHTQGRGHSEQVAKCVTAEMTTKYLKPILIGKKMTAYGKVEKEEGRCVFASAVIVDEDGEIMSTGSGRFVKVTNMVDSLTKDDEYLTNRMNLTENDPKEL